MDTVRKILFVVVLAILSMQSAQADWIYWMVDFSVPGAEANPWTDTTTTPSVWVMASTDPLSYVDGTTLPNAVGGGTGMKMDGNASEAVTAFSLDGYDSAAWTFFLAMGMEPNEVDYISSGVSYSDLVQMGLVKSTMDATEDILNGGMMAWTPTHDVPEPTSGLLLFLGASLLALRRGRTVAGS